MQFKNLPPDWEVQGTEPPEELRKTNGWLAGYKPPASYFNWFWNKCYLCLKELQEKMTGLETSHNEDVKVINTELGKKAPLASPELTGVPTAPTAESGTATDQIATTKFVDNIVGAIDFSALQEHTLYVTNPNLNTLLEDRAYICAGTMTNAPMSNTYCILHVYDTESTNKVIQVCYVPQNDNSTRVFVRTVAGTTYGKWIEIATKPYVEDRVETLKMLIDENTFRSRALAGAITKDLTTLFIQTFVDTSAIDTSKGDGAAVIENYYKSEDHMFVKEDTATVVVYTLYKLVTTGNNYVWALVDWTDISGGSVKLEISRDNGTNFTEIQNNTLTSISSQPTGGSMILRITGSGKLKLKNVAWGCR